MPTHGGGCAGSRRGDIKATITDRDDPGEAMRKKFDGMREKLKSTGNSEDWNSVLRIVEKLSLPPDSEPKEYLMKLDQDLQKITALQAKDWLVNKLKKQNSVPLYENPVLKYSDLQQWIHKPVSLALGDFKLDLIETAFSNPIQEGSLSNFISCFSDRLCNNDQNFTFRHLVLNLLWNAKGPGIIKNGPMATGEDSKGSEEDPGPSRGDDKEQKTSGSSSGLSGHSRDKEINTPGSGPADSCDDNLEGDRDGGKQKENYNDGRPGTSEMSKIAMAFMGGLTVGKNWVQPLINKRSMEPFLITKRGVKSLIISRRSLEPLMVPLLPDSLGSPHASGLGQVLSLVPDCLDPLLLPTSPGPVFSSSEILEVLLELICTKTANVPAVKSPFISLHGPDLGEVQGLISASETTLIRNSPEEDMVNFIKKSIPSQSYFPTGQILFEIFSIHTNLCLIKTIVLHDDRGGTLIYESKEGEKDQFIKRRSIWLSEHMGRKPYAFMESLVLKGPSRSMSAHDGYLIIQTDVPVESSFVPDHPEIPGRVLFLDDDFLDKPRGNLISIRGGLVNITSVTFSNAVRSSIRFLLCSHQYGSSYVHPKVEGELILSVENYPFGFTIFKNQVEDEAVHFVRQSGTVFELPLTRDVLALPIGSRVRVLGTLKLATSEVFADQYLVLDENVVWAGWTVETGMYAAICIEASSFI